MYVVQTSFVLKS